MVSALVPGGAIRVRALDEQMTTCKSVGKPNKLRGNERRWTSIPSRGSRNTPSRFMLQKPGIKSGSYEPVSSKASFFFY